jgi:hypothetical protein
MQEPERLIDYIITNPQIDSKNQKRLRKAFCPEILRR